MGAREQPWFFKSIQIQNMDLGARIKHYIGSRLVVNARIPLLAFMESPEGGYI